jgi:hypothetical protein
MSAYSATATATASATSSSNATATASGSSSEEAYNNALNSASTAAYYSLAPLIHPPYGRKTCEQFCISCFDWRFADDVSNYQNIKGEANNYDNFCLAGGSIGYNNILPNYESGRICTDISIDYAYQLHNISEVRLFDHLDCGAYPLVYTPEELAGDGEFKLHVENLNKAEATILKTFPFITKVSKFIFDLSYNAIPIP